MTIATDKEGFVDAPGGRVWYRMPTLVISGEQSEAQLPLQEELRNGIPGAEMVILEDASHLAHFEQPEKYFEAARDHIRKAAA